MSVQISLLGQKSLVEGVFKVSKDNLSPLPILVTVLSFKVCLRSTEASQVIVQLVVGFFFFFFNILFIQVQRGRAREREGNISVWLLIVYPLLGTWPATQACALTRNCTSDPLRLRQALNPQSHTSQGCLVCFRSVCVSRNSIKKLSLLF